MPPEIQDRVDAIGLVVEGWGPVKWVRTPQTWSLEATVQLGTEPPIPEVAHRKESGSDSPQLALPRLYATLVRKVRSRISLNNAVWCLPKSHVY